MQYMLLICGDEAEFAKVSHAERDKTFAEYMALNDELRARGVFRDGQRLHPSGAATTVRVRDGKRTITDGPFAETKEQLGGFYVLDCKDLDEALEFAAKIPGARSGSIEVRPVMEMPSQVTK